MDETQTHSTRPNEQGRGHADKQLRAGQTVANCNLALWGGQTEAIIEAQKGRTMPALRQPDGKEEPKPQDKQLDDDQGQQAVGSVSNTADLPEVPAAIRADENISGKRSILSRSAGGRRFVIRAPGADQRRQSRQTAKEDTHGLQRNDPG